MQDRVSVGESGCPRSREFTGVASQRLWTLLMTGCEPQKKRKEQRWVKVTELSVERRSCSWPEWEMGVVWVVMITNRSVHPTQDAKDRPRKASTPNVA